MENIVRTIYGSFLQTCNLLGLPFSRKANTTLNEKFNIQADTLPGMSEMPKMRYFAIGNGGHRMSIGSDGIAIPQPIQHRSKDAALFHHLPFVLREPQNDLANTERANYGLRREETWNGVRYIAYYLKRIPLGTVVAEMEYKTVNAGQTDTTPFIPDSSNLNPAPPELSPTGVNVVTGDYTTASAKISLALSAWDVTELLNVAKVIYDNEDYAIISEVGLVSGIDKVIQVPGVGASVINFNEVICAQVVSHISTFYPLRFSTNGTELILDVGATEPLYSLN